MKPYKNLNDFKALNVIKPKQRVTARANEDPGTGVTSTGNRSEISRCDVFGDCSGRVRFWAWKRDSAVQIVPPAGSQRSRGRASPGSRSECSWSSTRNSARRWWQSDGWSVLWNPKAELMEKDKRISVTDIMVGGTDRKWNLKQPNDKSVRTIDNVLLTHSRKKTTHKISLISQSFQHLKKPFTQKLKFS